MPEVTLREVAQESGYSVATVSRVLAGTRTVGAQTERRVRAVAAHLGYRPNQVARALRSRSTGTIGMVLPQITNPFFPALVRAVEHALHSRGRALLIADCDDDPAVEADRVSALLDRQVDALLVIPVHEEHSRVAVRAAAERVPVVQLDRRCGTDVADTVAVDNTAGMTLVLDHLARTGRSRPCFLGSDGTDSAAVERRAAYQGALSARDPEGASRVVLGDFSVEWGRAAAERVWPDRPDALVCANDLIAVGAMQQLRRIGADVPSQIAVTGFDDVAIASLAEPALTTVRQPVTGLAEEAVRLLDQCLGEQGPRPNHAVRLAPELVERASTAARTKEAH